MRFTFYSRGSVVIRAAVLSGALPSASGVAPQKIEVEPVAEKTVALRDVLRMSARHRRSGRQRTPRARDVKARRKLNDRRACSRR
jgi:hypothetical protein